jgi:TetR/AcrR family transcriptional regulator, transcriptional repressor for nem operon
MRGRVDTHPIRTYVLVMGRQSNRDKIIEAGVATVHHCGFAASGVRDIAAAAEVPLGSFTNHFRSKDRFAVAVLDRYFAGLQTIIGQTLRDQSRPPLARLHAYFDAITGRLAACGWRHGCLIGNLSLEVPEHSEALRIRLSELFAEWTQPFAEAVAAAQQAGELRADLDADDVAAVLLAGWHGAMMRMKVDRSREPLDRFRRVVLATILAAPPIPSP